MLVWVVHLVRFRLPVVTVGARSGDSPMCPLMCPLSRCEVSCYSDAVLSEAFSELSVTEDRQLIVDVTESGDQGAWVAPRGAGRWADAVGFFNVAADPFSVTGEVIQRSYQLFYVGYLVDSC